MAARDAADTIAESIESVQRQSFRDWQLLVVDDGSTDSTFRIAKEHEERDGRIAVLATSGVGPSAARNAALEEARGRYVAILDADDLATEDRLQAQISALDGDPSLAAVASAAFHFIRDGVAVAVRTGAPTSKAELASMVKRGAVVVWSNSTMCWRRDALTTLDGFDPTFPTAEDAELMNRAIYRHGMFIVGLPERLVWYRLSSASLSSVGLREQRMIARYLEYRNRCWLQDEEPQTLPAFLSRTPRPRERLRWARHDLGAQWYRTAGIDRADGRWTGVFPKLLLAATLHPRYVARKLWSQRLNSGWKVT
jgi:glycosyltransferase involved in cell wall biosynthesis